MEVAAVAPIGAAAAEAAVSEVAVISYYIHLYSVLCFILYSDPDFILYSVAGAMFGSFWLSGEPMWGNFCHELARYGGAVAFQSAKVFQQYVRKE